MFTSGEYSSQPFASVILPAYRSQSTIASSLVTLRGQTFSFFEVIVVDSSPDEATALLVSTGFPEVRLIRSKKRLLPHAARNRGVKAARGNVLVFADPDLEFQPDWLDRLVETHRRVGGIVVGAVLCAGNGWLDRGFHLGKYDSWLPSGNTRRATRGHSASLLCGRREFESVGGFDETLFAGDTLFCQEAQALGVAIWFEPKALVRHRYRSTWLEFIHERFLRGYEFAFFRVDRFGLSPSNVWWVLILTILPVRLAKLMLRIMRHAVPSGMLGDFVSTLPVTVAGQSAWLAGEVLGYFDWWRRSAVETKV